MFELSIGILWYLVFLVSVSLHESAHGLCARRLGDPTAAELGLAGLDPIPHIKREPFGMVILPVISIFLNGWPIGFAHVPFDAAWAAEHPRRSGLVALAGPGLNLCLALLAGCLLKAGLALEWFSVPGLTGSLLFGSEGNYALGTLASVLSVFFSLNLILGLFNLLPFPPLDGSGVLSLFLPSAVSRKYLNLINQPLAGMVGLLLAWNVFPRMFGGVFAAFIRLTH